MERLALSMTDLGLPFSGGCVEKGLSRVLLHYAYVDNYGAFRTRSSKFVGEINMHETKAHEGKGQTLGLVLGGVLLRTANTSGRPWQIPMAIRALLERRKATGRMEEPCVSLYVRRP